MHNPSSTRAACIDNKVMPYERFAKKTDSAAALSKALCGNCRVGRDDFRSVNGQIEYLLSECVRQRKQNGKYVSDEIDMPLDIDIE